MTVRGEYLHLHGLLGIRIGLQMCPTIFVYVLLFLFLLPCNMLQEVPTFQSSSFGSKISDSGSVVVVCESIYYRPQRSWAKVMFLQASVILSTGGCLPQCMLGYHPPWSRHLPRRRHPPSEQTPPGTRPPPDQTPPESRLRHNTVNERPVHILLECILVISSIHLFCYQN